MSPERGAAGRVAPGEVEVRDEVCGMRFPARQAVATVRYGGRTYYFCARRCRDQFKEAPERYVPVAEADRT